MLVVESGIDFFLSNYANRTWLHVTCHNAPNNWGRNGTSNLQRGGLIYQKLQNDSELYVIALPSINRQSELEKSDDLFDSALRTLSIPARVHTPERTSQSCPRTPVPVALSAVKSRYARP
jgi:hypothetical protein